MNKFSVTSLFSLLMCCAPAFAQDAPGGGLEFDKVCKGKIVNINKITNGAVLYKFENIHGGRGATFLVQNEAERTGKQVIEIRNARCEPIGAFGLYATDFPYGARYYTRTGGTGQSGDDLLAQAKLVGSTNILVEGKDKWILVKDPTLRDGTINK